MGKEEKGVVSPCSIVKDGKVIFQCEKAFSHDFDRDRLNGNGIEPELACPKLVFRREMLAKKKAGWGAVYPEDFILGVSKPLENPCLHIKPYKDWQNLITPQYDYFGWVAKYSKNSCLQDLKYGLNKDGLPDTMKLVCEGPFRWGYTQADFDSQGYPKIMDVVKIVYEEPDIGVLQGARDYLDGVQGTLYMTFGEEFEVEPRSTYKFKNEGAGDPEKMEPKDRKDRVVCTLLKTCGATGMIQDFISGGGKA